MWTGGVGDWFAAGNWSAGVPAAATDAQINNNGTAQIAAAGAVANTLILGRLAIDSGFLEVSGAGGLTNSSSLTVGDAGTGTLTIQSGGQVSNTQGAIGINAGSDGTVTVDGAGSTWTNSSVLLVGISGTGTLTIQNDGDVSNTSGFIGFASASTGTVTVDGAGSTWTNGGSLFVGFGGTGTLTIQNGGLVQSVGGVIGEQAGSVGVATISGPGSMWDTGGTDIVVGNFGDGTLNILAGAVVNTASGSLGANPGSSGTVSVLGAGSTLNAAGPIFVGGNNVGPQGTGLLRIADGGTVNAPVNVTVYNTGTLEIGANPVLNTPLLTFDGGTLRTIANTTFPNDATLAAGGVTVDSNGFSSTLSGVLSGPGGLTKTGTGRITLTAANTYTGDTVINLGELIVTGSTASANTFVNPGGLLGGTGLVGGNVFNNGIVSPGLSPGLSPGTLSVGGSYTQAPGGTLRVEIASPTLFDRLVVGGSANLGGTLQVITLGGFVPQFGEQYPVLTAGGGVGGRFATLEQSMSTAVFGARYEPNAVILELVATQFAPFFNQVLPAVLAARGGGGGGGGPRDARAADRVFRGLTPNQTAVARALDTSSGDPRQNDLLNFLLRENLGELPGDFDRIAPEELGALFEVTLATGERHVQTLAGRLRNARSGANGFNNGLMLQNVPDPPASSGKEVAVGGGKNVRAGEAHDEMLFAGPDNPWGVWTGGSGEFIDVDGDGNGSGFDFHTGGISAGIDYRFSDTFVAGLAGSYAGTNVDLTEGGDAEVDGARLALYGSWHQAGGAGAYLDGVFGGGFNTYDARRRSIEGFASGDTQGYEIDALLGGGYDIDASPWLTFGPLGSLGYTGVGIDGYRERGSLAPLAIDEQSEASLNTRLGARVAAAIPAGGLVLRPELSAQWQHEYLDDSRSIGAGFANGAPGSFTVYSPGLGADSAIVGGGLLIEWAPAFQTYFNYEGELGRENFDRHSFYAGIQLQF